MSIIVVQVLKSLQLTPRQAIKVCAHDLVNEIHEIKTAKHFIYTVIYIGETLAHFNRLSSGYVRLCTQALLLQKLDLCKV